MLGQSEVLSFDATIDRRAVHRTSNASVFLTSICPAPSGGWELGVQVPPPWLAVRRRTRSVPFLYMCEVLRQCGLAVAHLQLDVPLSYAFTMEDFHLRWDRGQVHYPEYGPFECRATVIVVDIALRRGIASHVTVNVNLFAADGTRFASGGGRLRCTTAQQYRAVRRAHVGDPGGSTRSDRSFLRRTEVASDQLHATLGWDTSDPFVFDHKTDHVPGIALIGAAAEATQLLSGSEHIDELAMKFSRFVEFASETHVLAERDDDDPSKVLVSLYQEGAEVASGACHASA